MSACRKNVKEITKKILKRSKCAHCELPSLISLRCIQYIRQTNTAVGSPKTSGDLWVVSVNQASGESIFPTLVHVWATCNTHSLTHTHKTERQQTLYEASAENKQLKVTKWVMVGRV